MVRVPRSGLAGQRQDRRKKSMYASPSPARKREEQGRLFWVWLLTLPIILLRLASFAFGAPWPNALTQRIAMLMLAFPVLFVVGEPLLADAVTALRTGRPSTPVIVAGVALACYASGVLALFTTAPPIAGVSALVVCAYLTLRYLFVRY
jgi:cation transport ATPase